MALIPARSAALSAALIVSALSSTTALAQDAGSAPPARTEAVPATTTTTTTTTTAESPSAPVAPASSYAVAPSASDEVAPRRASGSHEPLLDTETQRLTWPNIPLLVTGSAVFAASYAPAVVGAVVSDRGDDKLYIPVAGPWMTLAQGPDEKNSYKALLIADGAVQGLGALMLVTSFFIPEKTTKNWYLIGSNDVRVMPTAGFGSTGLAASGRF